MARLAFAGWEDRDTVGLTTAPEQLQAAGTSGASVETTIVRNSGSKGSGKVALTSGATGRWTWLGSAANSNFQRVYVRGTARPASTARVLIGAISAGTINIRLNPNGTLAFFVNTTLIGTSSTALTDTTKWYRVEWRALDGTSVTVLQIDGTPEVTGSPSSWTNSLSFGSTDTVADTYTVYFDDWCIDDSAFPGPGGVALLLPTADSAVGSHWTAGAGSASNLWDAVNNTPPAGLASASETNTSNIEHAGGDAGAVSYDATMQTYTVAGVPSGATVNVVRAIAVTGEDIATGTKSLSHQILSNPVGTSSGAYDVNGGVSNAHGAYPTNWTRTAVSNTSPTVTLGTAPVLRVTRTAGETRTACVCFLGILVDYTESTSNAYTSSVAGSQPTATGTVTSLRTRALAGSQPTATGAAARLLHALRSLAGSQPTATGTAARLLAALRSLAGSQPTATGALTRIYQALRSLSGSQPTATGTIALVVAYVRVLAGAQPAATGTLDRFFAGARSLSGSQPAAAGAVSRLYQALRALAGSQPSASGVVAVSHAFLRALAGAQDAATGSLTRVYQALRSTAGSQPAATGAVARISAALRGLTGSQPAATGTAARLLSALRSLTGSQPGSTGTVARLLQALRPLAGSQPTATGTVARIYHGLRSLAGAQLAAAGEVLAEIAGEHAFFRTLAGAQDAATGSLERFFAGTRSLAGAQPSPAGTLARFFAGARALTGSQDAPAGTVARVLQAIRALAGAQPAASGVAGRILHALRSLAGSQPAASGAAAWIRFVFSRGRVRVAAVLRTTLTPGARRATSVGAGTATRTTLGADAD